MEKVIIPFSSIVEANGKTIRENNMELKHNIPIGTLVEVKYDRWHGAGACEKVHARLWVVEHMRDCDGTPLYTLANTKPENQMPFKREFEMFVRHYYGYVNSMPEERLTPIEITADLVRGKGALSWINDDE